MKEFYIMNLDKRRMAILAGGTLTVLGLCLIIGMAIGRGQGERQARLLQEEADQKKLGMAPIAEVSKPLVAAVPVATNSIPSAEPQTKSEIPVEADPMVAGPPRRALHKDKIVKSSHRPKKKKVKADVEISGEVEHASNSSSTKPKHENSGERYTIQVAAYKRSNDAKSLIDKLKGEGIKAKTEKNGNFYLVIVGRTKSKDKLEKALARLKELEYEAYIRKLKTAPASEET